MIPEKTHQIREEDIRPASLMRENALLNSEDIRDILTHQHAFVRVSCPACEADDAVFAFEKKGFRFETCKACATLFVNPRPSKRLLEEFYATSRYMKHWNEKIFSASETARREKIFAPRAKRVVELCGKFGIPGTLLVDVGAGYGTFCEEVRKLSYFEEVVAVEPCSSLAETCRGKGLEVVESMIEDLRMEKDVNVITNFELIEHLYWPKDFLRACYRVLPGCGGYVILTTPNIKGFELSVLREHADNIVAPNHLNYFHPGSLARLSRDCGFEVVEALTPGKLDAELVRKKIVDGTLDASRERALRMLLVERWDDTGTAFQDFLATHMLSSHLWMILRKREE